MVNYTNVNSSHIKYGINIGRLPFLNIYSGFRINKCLKDKNFSLDFSDKLRINGLSSSFFKTDYYLKDNIEQSWKMIEDSVCYKQLRYSQNLPINGQRSRTNAGTAKRRRKFLIDKNKNKVEFYTFKKY